MQILFGKNLSCRLLKISGSGHLRIVESNIKQNGSLITHYSLAELSSFEKVRMLVVPPALQLPWLGKSKCSN